MARFSRVRSFTILPALVLCVGCWAGGLPALVVHDGTSGTEADVLSNISSKLTSAGYTVTASTSVPGGSLASYKQIWDVRFNNTTPLTAGDISAYVAYLASGGSLFVMGENVANFATRDASISSLILSAGGGVVNIISAANAETVQAPFTGPNAVSAITFLATGGAVANGSLSFIAKDANNVGAGLLFAPGSLTNATAGSLLTIFDVNFLLTGADANSQALTNNLIAYLATPVSVPPASTPAPPITTPTLSEWAMILLVVGLMLLAFRRLYAHQRAIES